MWSYMTSPTIILNSPKNETAIHPGSIIELEIADNTLESVTHRWDDNIAQTLHSPYDVVAPLQPGWHHLYVVAMDQVGHSTMKHYAFSVFSSPGTTTEEGSSDSSPGFTVGHY